MNPRSPQQGRKKVFGIFKRTRRIYLGFCSYCPNSVYWPPWPSKIGDKVACDSCVGKMVKIAA